MGRIWKNPLCLHLLWVFVLLKLVTPPVVTVPIVLPARQAPPAPEARMADQRLAHPSHVDASQQEITSITMDQELQPLANDRAVSENPAPDLGAALVTQYQGIPWLTVLGWMWGVGIVVFASGRVYRILRFRKLLHCGEAPASAVLSTAEGIAKRLGLRRAPDIRILPVCVSPLVWSLGGMPKVFLPAALFERLDGAAQEAILAHELAHVRRKDHWVRLLEVVITTLFWWHPAVWWAARQLQELEDQCCDGMVVDMAPHSAKSYATALLDTLDFLCERSIAAPLGATAAKSSISLTRRIAMLKNRSWTARLTFGRLMLLLTLAALPMALAFGQKPPKTTEKTPPVVIELRIVDVPRDLDLVRRLPSGSVILNAAEAKQFLEDHKANVLQCPRVTTRLGLGVFVSSPWGTQESLLCQVIPEVAKEPDVIALRIKPDLVKQGQIGTAMGDPKNWQWRTSIHAELKPGEAVAFGGWDDARNDSHDAKHVTVFLAQANHIGQGRASEQPVAERRAVNKLVKDFPEKVDLSTPESAAAAYHRLMANPKATMELSAWKYGPQDIEQLKQKNEAVKDKFAKLTVAYQNAEIIEVITYRGDMAEVISKLKFPDGVGSNPYSARSFVRINGQWKNFGENRLPSAEEARKNFDCNKDAIWENYIKVLDGLKKGNPVQVNVAGDLHSLRANRASIAPGEPLGISVEKADLMGRVEWAMMHGGRDITARKTIEWGDVEKDADGNRKIRYKFYATIWDKDVVTMNKVFTFDAKGNILDMEDVEGFPQKVTGHGFCEELVLRQGG
ncbi:MAG: M56 family metallopeptidase [Bryobacteraceae bacterium]